MKKRFRTSLSPSPDVERVPRLDREFRRPPPPHQNKRRKPSRAHLQTLTTATAAGAAGGYGGTATTIPTIITPMETGPLSSGETG